MAMTFFGNRAVLRDPVSDAGDAGAGAGAAGAAGAGADAGSGVAGAGAAGADAPADPPVPLRQRIADRMRAQAPKDSGASNAQPGGTPGMPVLPGAVVSADAVVAAPAADSTPAATDVAAAPAASAAPADTDVTPSTPTLPALHLGDGEFVFDDEAGASAATPTADADATAATDADADATATPVADADADADAAAAADAQPAASLDLSSLPPAELEALRELHEALETGDHAKIEQTLSRTGRGRAQITAFKTLRAVEDGDPDNNVPGVGYRPSTEQIRQWHGDAEFYNLLTGEMLSGDVDRIDSAVGNLFGNETTGTPPADGMQHFAERLLYSLSRNAPSLYNAAVQPQRVSFLNMMADQIADLPAGDDGSTERGYRDSVVHYFRNLEHRVSGESRPASWFTNARRTLSPQQAQAEENRQLKAQLAQQGETVKDQAWQGFLAGTNQELQSKLGGFVDQALADVHKLYPVNGAADPDGMRDLFNDERTVFVDRAVRQAKEHPSYRMFTLKIDSAKRVIASATATQEQRTTAQAAIVGQYDQIVRQVVRTLRPVFVKRLARAATAQAGANNAQLANAARADGVADSSTGQPVGRSVLSAQPGNGQPGQPGQPGAPSSHAGTVVRREGEPRAAYVSRAMREKMTNAVDKSQRAGRL